MGDGGTVRHQKHFESAAGDASFSWKGEGDVYDLAESLLERKDAHNQTQVFPEGYSFIPLLSR